MGDFVRNGIRMVGMRRLMCVGMVALLGGQAVAQTTQPADATLEWLLDQAEPAPTTQPTSPTTQPASPFLQADRPDARSAVITLSDGSVLKGNVTTTPDKPIRVWDDRNETYRDIPFRLICSLEAHVLWERDEPEWRFLDSGSDLKEQTGRTYPARELQYTITLVNGQTLHGGIVAPLYFKSATDSNRRQTLVLHKRQKGEIGQTLEQLIYLQKVELAE